MKKIKGLSIILVSLLVLLFLVSPISAAEKDSAGNVFEAQNETTEVSTSGDYYWAGNLLNITDSKVEFDVIAAGRQINITNGTIGANLRLAAAGINLLNTNVKNNITLVGNTILIDEASSASGVYAAGRDISFSGKAHALTLYGSHVHFDGNVDGDVSIEANSVTFGENVKVTGTLKVIATTEPVLPENAQIGDYVYDEKLEDYAISSEELVENKVLDTIKSLLKGIINTLLFATLFVILLNPGIQNAGEMLKNQSTLMLLSGLIALFLSPGLIAFLLVIRVGSSVGILASLLVAALFMVSTAFSGCVLGQLVFKKFNVWGSSFLGAVIVYILIRLPFIGWLVRIASWIITFGWIIQKIWQRFPWKNVRGIRKTTEE